MGHEDLDFLISASVNRPTPDKVLSAFDAAEVHAVLMGFSRLKPANNQNLVWHTPDTYVTGYYDKWRTEYVKKFMKGPSCRTVNS